MLPQNILPNYFTYFLPGKAFKVCINIPYMLNSMEKVVPRIVEFADAYSNLS